VTTLVLAIVSLGLMAGSAKAAGGTQVGQVLHASPLLPGDPVDWYTCDSSGNVSGAPVAADTDTDTDPDAYTVQESDLTTDLCWVETFGPGLTSSPSPPVGPVIDPDIQLPLEVSGSFVEGHTLTASPETWEEPGYTIEYQWEDCGAGSCTPIALNATSQTYTPVLKDVGQDVEVLETPVYATPASNAAVQSTEGDTVAAAPSKPTPTPTPTPKVSSAPSISGTTQLGQTLTANVGTGLPTETSYDYQWSRCALNCTAISGAVGATYALGDSDVGDTIAVTVTAGTTAATSARTGTVTAPSTLQIVASPTNPFVNQSVSIVGVVTSTAAGTDPSGTVAFADDGSVISGCADVSVPATGQTVTVSCTTSFPVSSPSLSASFSPAASSPLLGSSASRMALSVGRGYSTTSLDVPAKARRGATTTYTASIAAGRNLIGPVLPAGTVSFLDHGKAIAGCQTARIKDGGATCTVHNAQIGTQTISARYGGDADFRGSSSSVKSVQISAAPSKRAKVLGSVTATMQWTFHYHPSFTQITALVLHGAKSGGMVTIHCTGRGCPFASRAHAVVKQKRCRSTKKHTCPAPGTIDLEPSFRHHRLRVHAQVTITVTHTRYVGKYYRFTMRARRQPSVKISCLAVGSSKPGVGCAAP
jgi:hypothetical protein